MVFFEHILLFVIKVSKEQNESLVICYLSNELEVLKKIDLNELGN